MLIFFTPSIFVFRVTVAPAAEKKQAGQKLSFFLI